MLNISLTRRKSGGAFCYSHVKNKNELNFFNLKLYIMKAFLFSLLFAVGLNANAQRQVFNYGVINGDTIHNDFYVYTKNVAPDSTHLFITQYLDPNFSYDSLTVEIFNEPILKREIIYEGYQAYNDGKTMYKHFKIIYVTPRGTIYFWTVMLPEQDDYNRGIYILKAVFEDLNWFFSMTQLKD